jgi:hypothetical protein
MIAVESNKRSRCAEAIGPCGSNTPAGAQEVRRMAAPTTDQGSRRERLEQHGGRAILPIKIAQKRRAERRQQAILGPDDSTRCVERFITIATSLY